MTMTKATSTQPVVVGIDGSLAAVEAALWAIDEAVHRDVPLRLVNVTAPTQPLSAPYDENDVEIQYGESSLRVASSAVTKTGKSVKVETQILHGPVDEALIAESMSASVMYVGSVGIGWIARRVLGSTAFAVAKNARCPVAIVRYPEVRHTEDSRCVVVGIDDRLDNDRLVTHALDEAQLRHAPVLAVGTWSSELGDLPYDELDRRVETWQKRYPELHIRSVSSAGGLPAFLAGYRDDVQLAVVSDADAEEVPQIIGPHEGHLVPHAQCSVMVVH